MTYHLQNFGTHQPFRLEENEKMKNFSYEISGQNLKSENLQDVLPIQIRKYPNSPREKHLELKCFNRDW